MISRHLRYGVVLAFCLAAAFAGLAAAEEVHIVFTSDQHYGISRKRFRGEDNVPAAVVNAAMVEAINSLPEACFPADGGVMACRRIGFADLVVSGGDIANRMEGTGPPAVMTAAECWRLFLEQYDAGLNVKNRAGEKTELLVIPGNHDASNAIGFFRPMTPPTDNAAMVGMYNRATGAAIPPEDFDYARHKVFLSRDIAGIRLYLVQMWPDSAMRELLARDLATLPEGAPAILFTHMQPDIDANRLTNPNGDRGINAEHKFENLVADVSSVAGAREIPLREHRDLARFIKDHPAIAAYFHGHEHQNIYYEWKGPDGDISLPTFMTDSPMKGKISEADDTKVSFQSVAIDTAARRMTVREVRWNVNPDDPAIHWGDSMTFNY